MRLLLQLEMAVLTTKNNVKSGVNDKSLGKERADCGKTKQVIINPSRGCLDTFNRL